VRCGAKAGGKESGRIRDKAPRLTLPARFRYAAESAADRLETAASEAGADADADASAVSADGPIPEAVAP
jgi:hypothetical protein